MDSIQVQEIIQGLHTGEFLCDKPVQSNRSRADVWKYFNQISKANSSQILNFICCKKCMKVYSFNRKMGTSTFTRHLEKCSGTVTENTNRSRQSDFQDEKNLSSEDIINVKADVTKMFVRWCAKDLRPFEISKDEGLRDLFQHSVRIGTLYGNINVSSVVPSPRTVSRNVDIEYNSKVKALFPEINAAPLLVNIFSNLI